MVHGQIPQNGPPQSAGVPGVPPLLERLDPSYGDVSPLGASLSEMNMQADMRQSGGFQYVYRVPGREDLLMRQSGGLYVIFPQSTYVPTRRGLVPTVPPGTMFSIGMPGPWTLPSPWVRGPSAVSLDAGMPALPSSAQADGRSMWTGATAVDSRRHARRQTISEREAWTAEGPVDGVAIVRDEARYEVARATPPEPSTFLVTVVTNDEYRAARLAELLARAARAATSGDDQRQPTPQR
jgi:hypothetical protein